MCRSRFASESDRAPLKAGMATAHPSSSLETPKRRADDRDALTTRFQLLQIKKPTRIASIPKVINLSMGVSSVTPPPMNVLAKLGCPSFIVGVDIETADWVDRKRSATRKGQFGFYHFCHDDDFNQRIVQIGWAAGEARDGTPLQTYKEDLVRPEGSVISEKATAKHSISQ